MEYDLASQGWRACTRQGLSRIGCCSRGRHFEEANTHLKRQSGTSRDTVSNSSLMDRVDRVGALTVESLPTLRYLTYIR